VVGGRGLFLRGVGWEGVGFFGGGIRRGGDFSTGGPSLPPYSKSIVLSSAFDLICFNRQADDSHDTQTKKKKTRGTCHQSGTSWLFASATSNVRIQNGEVWVLRAFYV
jgi:hypothetical protein